MSLIIIVAAALAQQWAGLAQISARGAQVEAGWAEPPRATPHFNHCPHLIPSWPPSPPTSFFGRLTLWP